MSFDEDGVDVKQLRAFYEKDNAARAVLDHFANRERNQNTTTVRRLNSNVNREGSELPRGEIVRVLKKLEEFGCGEFKAGRKGYESRFEWHVSSKSVGQVAAGEATEVESEVPDLDVADEPSEEFLDHAFQLRPEVTITVRLPADLNAREAERLSTFVKTLPFA